MTEQEPLELNDAVRSFILHWGEMGSRWGINRTIAQIHALLYVAPRPLNAEEIASTLSIARSTVSTSLRELQTWGVVRLVHVLGDRRDHYEALDDVWEMFRLVLDERKRRELDPTLEILREGVEQAKAEADDELGQLTHRKLKEMLEFFEAVSSLYEKTQNLPTPLIKRLARSPENVKELVNAPNE